MVTKKQKLKIAVIGSSRYGEINNIYKKIAYDTGKAIANNVFKNPTYTFDTLIFTGFGHKGRNVVLVRSSDAVIALNGGVGTLNELTIALDEGKDIGILSNSGLTINHFLDFYNKISEQSKFLGSLIVKDKPEELVKALIKLSSKRKR